MSKKQPEEPLDSTETLKTEIRERAIEMEGRDETLKELTSQIGELASILDTPNDFAIIKGELKKLILLEDENFELKKQVRALESNKKRDIKETFLGLQSRLRRKEKVAIKLEEENQQLKSRKQLDRNKTIDLVAETTRRLGKGLGEEARKLLQAPRRSSKFVLKKLKGGE